VDRVYIRVLDAKIKHLHTRTQNHIIHGVPEKKGEIFIKGQINNPNEKFFYVERYSRKEQFNSTNQSILSHPGLFPVIVARLHILLRFCAIVLYLVVYHVCFQDGKLCLLVANDKLDGK
jgi:hypothetical protein